MRGLYISSMTDGAGAAAGRNTWLQIRDSRMTEATITIMGDINRCIFGTAGIVTVVTWA